MKKSRIYFSMPFEKCQEYTFLWHLKNVKNILVYDFGKTSIIYLFMTFKKHQARFKFCWFCIALVVSVVWSNNLTLRSLKLNDHGWTWLQIQTWIPQHKSKYNNIKLKWVDIPTFYQIVLFFMPLKNWIKQRRMPKKTYWIIMICSLILLNKS